MVRVQRVVTPDLPLLRFPVWLVLEVVQAPQRPPGLKQQQQRHQDPQPVKENQIEPQVHPVRGIQVRAAQQPIRTEGHPAAVQLAHAQNDLQEVPGEQQQSEYLSSATCWRAISCSAAVLQ